MNLHSWRFVSGSPSECAGTSTDITTTSCSSQAGAVRRCSDTWSKSIDLQQLRRCNFWSIMAKTMRAAQYSKYHGGPSALEVTYYDHKSLTCTGSSTRQCLWTLCAPACYLDQVWIRRIRSSWGIRQLNFKLLWLGGSCMHAQRLWNTSRISMFSVTDLKWFLVSSHHK